MVSKKYETVDEYLADYPDNTRAILNKIRKLISDLAPESVEGIAYNMPAFKLAKKPLVYFAAFKNHIGFYALPSGNQAFQEELSTYKTGKGSIQFPVHEEIPYHLISQIVQFRILEVIDKNNK